MNFLKNFSKGNYIILSFFTVLIVAVLVVFLLGKSEASSTAEEPKPAKLPDQNSQISNGQETEKNINEAKTEAAKNSLDYEIVITTIKDNREIRFVNVPMATQNPDEIINLAKRLKFEGSSKALVTNYIFSDLIAIEEVSNTEDFEQTMQTRSSEFESVFFGKVYNELDSDKKINFYLETNLDFDTQNRTQI